MLCCRALLLVYLSGGRGLLNLPAPWYSQHLFILKPATMCKAFSACTRKWCIHGWVWSVKGQIVQNEQSGIQYKCKTIWDMQQPLVTISICTTWLGVFVGMKRRSGPALNSGSLRRSLNGAEQVEEWSSCRSKTSALFSRFCFPGSALCGWLDCLQLPYIHIQFPSLFSKLFLLAFWDFVPVGIQCTTASFFLPTFFFFFPFFIGVGGVEVG